LENLALFLINDECGINFHESNFKIKFNLGIGNSNGKKRYNGGECGQLWRPKTVQRIIYRDSIRIVQEREQEVARINGF
jgi:hypothetical protein